jgi:dihydroorotate dehydrogenase electron transfer subunit
MSCRTNPKRRGAYLADVLSNEVLCDEHFLLRLGVGGFPPTRPGQFVQLQCRHLSDQVVAREVAWPPKRPLKLDQPELADKEPLLRRPFSLAGRRGEGDTAELDIIYRTVGAGTRWLSATVKAGDRLSLLGPLGNGFTIRDDKPHAVLVGGGVGIPPMLYLAEAMTQAGKEVLAFNGVRTARFLPLKRTADKVCPVGHGTLCIIEFARHNVESVVATDDGSLGFHGPVSQAFQQWLDRTEVRQSDLAVYACGPEAMMKAVGDLCVSRGIDCQLALERHMACGVGTCQSCVCKIRDANDRGWSYKLVCTDGPVFEARNVLW